MTYRPLLAAVLTFLCLGTGAARAEGIKAPSFGNDELKLRPSLFVQLQGKATRTEEGVDTDAFIRRIRPRLFVSMLEGRVTSLVHLEMTPTSPELIDLFIDGKITDFLSVRVGQFKTPFTQYWQYSLIELAVDWPTTSKWFGGERQLGAQASGKLPWGFGYAGGVFAGDNRRATFSRELARLYGEKIDNPSLLTAFNNSATGGLHPELMLRVFHQREGMVTKHPIDRDQGGFRHHVGLSMAWDTNAVKRRDFVMRFAPEAILKWQGFSLHTVAYFAMFRDRRDRVLPGSAGGIVELGWRPHRLFELTARGARTHVLPDLDQDAKFSAAPSGLLAQTEVTGGVHVLLLGRSLVWQNDLGLVRDERRDGATSTWTMRSQLQLAF